MKSRACRGSALIKAYSAYLFDLDGTLLDTTELIYRCFLHTFEHFDVYAVSRDQIMAAIGLPLRAQMEKHFGPLTDDEYKERERVHMEYQLSVYRDYLRTFPGVPEMLSRLALHGRRCAVVTSRRRQSLELFLTETGIRMYFPVLVTPESTVRHKPHPDPALEALRMLGVSSEEAIMVGDSVFDMECGAAARIDTAFALWSGGQPPSRPQPTFHLTSPLELIHLLH